MSNAQKALAGILPVMIMLLFSTANAENPTPHNEWDFDFIGIAVFQDSNNLNTLRISIPVVYHGQMPLGTVEVTAIVTGPDGKIKSHYDLIRDMKIGESQVLEFKHKMTQEGTYTVEMSMTPPTDPHMYHIFDIENQIFTVEPNGLERTVEAIVVDSEEMISYKVEKPSAIRDFEVLHAVIDLPKDHTFEKIIVENGSIDEHPIDSKDIYIDYSKGFQDIKVNLVRQNNLLPNAGAVEDSFQNYVKFYAVDNDVCYSVDCVTIHEVTEEPEEIPIWMLGIILVGIVVVVVAVIAHSKLKSKPQSPEKAMKKYWYPKKEP